ncbi:MAG: molybdopterin converting factor subunit 1 [Anaerolineaceae bacterium]|nr:molybdopterin converting factor subunit 1 [Anaerolineaceae bacterium]
MQINVLLFASLGDLAGQRRLTLSLDRESATVADLRDALGLRQPTLREALAAAIAAVNEEYATDAEELSSGDTVAFFPPVSGGSGYPEVYRLAKGAIDHDAVVAAVTLPETGAVCLFSGMVRGETRRGDAPSQTTMLEYEAYESMALDRMQQVGAEIRQRWPLVQGIAILQRTGKLAVGQNTVLIACSSAHRDQGCFEAARYGIDRLKEIVPVWKREIGPGGSVWIEGKYRPGLRDNSE